MAYSGLFKPKNPQKYVGDPTNIVYRSSWECKVMSWLDRNPSIISWASEELIIPYKSPVDNRFHRYFPDFYIKSENKIIEVKSAWTYNINFDINQLKMQSCLNKKYNFEFMIID